MNRLLIIALVLLGFKASVYSNEKIDSLKKVYVRQTELNEKTITALTIASQLRNVDNEKSVLFVNKAIAHSIADQNQMNLAHAYELKGSILTGMGKTKDALELLFGAINIYESLDSIAQISTTYNSIGNAYLDLDDIEKCTKYYKMSYDYAMQTSDTSVIAVPLVGLGIAYSEVGDYKPALEYSIQAADMFEQIKRDDAYCISMANAASYAYEFGDRNLSDSLIAKAKEAALKIDSKYFKGEILLMESEWMADEGRYSLAIDLANKGIQLMEEIDATSNVMTAKDYLADYYSKAKRHEEAYETLRSHLTLKDSLNEENKTEVVEELNTKYETAEKEKEIVALNADNELQYLENKKNQTIIWIVLTCSILLLGLVIFSIRAYFQKKKSNETLTFQNKVIEDKNREILDSITYAKRIQNAIIPSSDIIQKNLNNSFVLYAPKDIVAGDFYWIEKCGDIVLTAVADCTGHGVPGAMLSVICNNALNRSVREFDIKEPAKILDKTREIVIETLSQSSENVNDGMDISICSWNQITNEIQWAGANNPLYYIENKNPSEVKIIKPDKEPVGNHKSQTSYTNHVFQLSKGDSLYLFSDGFMDQFGGEDGKKYKYSQFRKLLLSMSQKPMNLQGKELFEEFTKWKNDLEQLDDVCILGIKI